MQDDADSRARTQRWHDWELAFWAIVGEALGNNRLTGAARQFGDVYVMLDFVNNDGFIELGVVDWSFPTGPTAPGFSLRVFWDEHKPRPVADRVLEMVHNVRADAIFKPLNR